MSDYVVSRKRKRHAVDPCLGFYLSSGKDTSSPTFSPTNLSFKALATYTEFDGVMPSSCENERGIEDVCDAPHNRSLEDFPDHGLQRTPECTKRPQPENLGYGNLYSSSDIASDHPTQVMMTVEDFLKRSNKGKGMVKKQYGKMKMKKRIKRLGDNGALFDTERQYGILGSDDGETSQGIMQLRSKKIRRATIYESSSDESSLFNQDESSPLNIKMKKSRGRTAKPLRERLYEASVLTHGHPDDILVCGATISSEQASSRRPLRFIPNTQPEHDDSQMDMPRPRTWSLVDPRKSMAIRTASFSSKVRPCLQHMPSTSSGKAANLSVHPPKRWKFSDANLTYSSLSNQKSKREPIPAVKTFECAPLAFVSLKKAEEDYKSMFSCDKTGRLTDVCTTSPLRMVPVAETTSHVEVRMSVPAYNMHMVPLEEVIRRPDFVMEASAQVAVDQARTLDHLNNMSSASMNSSPIFTSTSSPTALAVPVTPKRTQNQPITPTRRRSLRTNVRERTLIRRDSDVSPKPMRPLPSFFNEFIQNIRNVTGPQDQERPSVSDRRLPSKRPLRKVTRNEYSPRISISQHAWTNDLETIRQNDPNWHMEQRTLDLPYDQCLGPDDLAMLKPQNYQVILSSPS